MPDIGVLICGHGSRDSRGPAELAALANQIARRFPHWTFGHGFLEFAEPTIADSLKRLTETGVRTIIAVPALLFAARHARTDIPAVLRAAAPGGVEIRYAEPLGFDPKLLRAAADRIEEAEAAQPRIGRDETLLLVVGRGTTDADANGDLAKLSRMLCEGMEFGWGETCYSGVTEPQAERALEHAAKLGYRRIVVMPYFLFAGTLVERVYAAIDAAAQRYPGIEFVKAGHLNDHPLIVEAFSDRIIDALEGPSHGRDTHGHHHDHAHDHDDCDDEWHIHAPGGPGELVDAYSLAPRTQAGGR